MRNLLLIAALLASSQAFAQRVCIVPFTGPSANGPRTQLVSALCDTADCVAPEKATTAHKPDWKKAKKEQVRFFITGAVTKKGRALTLTLHVLEKAGPPKISRSYPLAGSSLAPKTLGVAVDALRGALGAPDEPRPPPPPPPQTIEPEQKPPPRVEEAPPPAPQEKEPEVVAPPPAARRSQGFLSIDLGSDVTNRHFNYLQATSGNLRRYDLSLFPLPRLNLELYPLRLAGRRDLLAGLGLQADFAFAPFLKSRSQTGTLTFPTSVMRLDLGLRWKLVPFERFALAISPFAAVRLHSFTVGAATDGSRLDGLPDLRYLGLHAGLALDVPLFDEALLIFGHFAVLPIFSSRQLIGATYFVSGSNFGLEGAAGLGVRVLPFLQLRASFEYTAYSLTFHTLPADAYLAAGAYDRYLGGNASVRLTF